MAKKETLPKKNKSALVAKKDFRITQNDYERVIKKGEDISDLPERFLENMKTEGVI